MSNLLNLDPQQAQSFDILTYLNDMYMAKLAPTIDVNKAGGFHNIHTNGQTKVDEEILEINKKRIHIPNAEIKHFSYRQYQDIEKHNEPDHSTDDTDDDGSNRRDELFKRKFQIGERCDKILDEAEQKGSSGISLTEKDIIEI